MRICAFVLIALVAIAAAQQDTYTDDQKNQALECMQRIGEPCQSGNNEVKEACQDEVDQLDQCFDQCIDDNKETTNNIIGCVQLNCKSENNNAQTFFDQKTACMAILEENPSTGSEEEIKACQEELKKIENCLTQCTEQNKENTHEIIRCYKLNCKSENNDVQDYFEKKIASMNTGINILAFTVIASILSLLL